MTKSYELSTRIQDQTSLDFTVTRIPVADKFDLENHYRIELNTIADSINETVDIPKPTLNLKSVESFTAYKQTMNEMI